MNVDVVGSEDARRYLVAPMDRRRVLRLMAGAGAAAMAGAALLGGSASAVSFLKATSAVNLRAKASMSSAIKAVIPAGGLVVDLGVSSNGFRKVSYQGVRGYAYESLLVAQNGGSSDPVNVIGNAVTTTAVNLRYDASASGYVLAVIPKGTTVQIGDRVIAGYREVIANGMRGFIYDDYLAPAGGEGDGGVQFRTTAALNLREQPSTSAKIVLVIPAGAVVTDYDLVMSGAFRGVEYNGKTGWVSNNYLAEI